MVNQVNLEWRENITSCGCNEKNSKLIYKFGSSLNYFRSFYKIFIYAREDDKLIIQVICPNKNKEAELQFEIKRNIRLEIKKIKLKNNFYRIA